MSEELLSALLDGECTPAEAEAVLAAIERSPALKARWSRMCLTRDALAGVAVAKPSFDFAAGVMAAIASEAQAEASIEVNPRVVPLRRPAVVAQPAPVVQPQRVAARRRWQPITGLAAAASIAAVALIGGRALLNTPVDDGAVASGGSEVTASVNPNIVKVSADGEISGAGVQDSRWAQLDKETARQLNDYLLEHSNSRADAGMGGALGYARLAVRTADYRPADGSR
ncbi:sigma-E factor negative regulatory protein [uncultured Nevskia sp.]|uniref:sigma-E factor negative regulatory protein n=1 Tax=uncultured Nevskia sp. TaxID=228950 RepID=UPI0025DBDCC1|nr:sigma-E factor negative regulatory protein [uncultured Nevskia sp.]